MYPFSDFNLMFGIGFFSAIINYGPNSEYSYRQTIKDLFIGGITKISLQILPTIPVFMILKKINFEDGLATWFILQYFLINVLAAIATFSYSVALVMRKNDTEKKSKYVLLSLFQILVLGSHYFFRREKSTYFQSLLFYVGNIVAVIKFSLLFSYAVTILIFNKKENKGGKIVKKGVNFKARREAVFIFGGTEQESFRVLRLLAISANKTLGYFEAITSLYFGFLVYFSILSLALYVEHNMKYTRGIKNKIFLIKKVLFFVILSGAVILWAAISYEGITYLLEKSSGYFDSKYYYLIMALIFSYPWDLQVNNIVIGFHFINCLYYFFLALKYYIR